MAGQTVNMTEGSILKRLIGFAVPVLIGNIFQQLYNIADTAIIGNILGDDALAAVGAAAPVYGLVVSLANGITSGFAVMIARCFGANNDRQMKKSVSLTYILSAFIGAVLTVIRALTGTENATVIDTASMYIMINIVFFFVLSVLLVLRSSLQGVGRKLVPVSGSIVEFLLKILAASFLAPKLGYFGICVLEPMIWIICAGIVCADYAVFIRKTAKNDVLQIDKKTDSVV